MSDIHEFINASQAFFNRLGDVKTGPLAIALAFHTANLLLRTRAWYAILRAAYPNARSYRWRSCAGAYLSGVGLNALIRTAGVRWKVEEAFQHIGPDVTKLKMELARRWSAAAMRTCLPGTSHACGCTTWRSPPSSWWFSWSV